MSKRLYEKHSRRTPYKHCVFSFVSSKLSSSTRAFNLCFCIRGGVARAPNSRRLSFLPLLFQVVHQSWRILFSAFASVRYTRARVCYPIEYAMRMRSGIPRFFLNRSFSSPPVRLYLLHLPLFGKARIPSANLPNEDVISEDYNVFST